MMTKFGQVTRWALSCASTAATVSFHGRLFVQVVQVLASMLVERVIATLSSGR
jgi:hypothetical protein